MEFIAAVIVLLLIFLILILVALKYNLYSVKILKDIYFYQVFDFGNINQSTIWDKRLSYFQVYAYLLPYFGIFCYKNTQFDIHPTFHALFGLLFLQALLIVVIFFVGIGLATEFDPIVAGGAALLVSVVYIMLTMVQIGQLIGSYNKEPSINQNVENTKYVETAEMNDTVVHKNSVSNWSNESRFNNHATQKRSVKAPMTYEILVLMLVLAQGFAWVWVAILVSRVSNEEALACALMWLAGIPVDSILRVLFGLVFKRWFPVYSKQFVVQDYGITSSELNYYKRTPYSAADLLSPGADQDKDETGLAAEASVSLLDPVVIKKGKLEDSVDITINGGDESLNISDFPRYITPNGSHDFTTAIPRLIRRNKQASEVPKTFVFEEDEPEKALKSLIPLKPIEHEIEVRGYIASDPEHMSTRFDEPIFKTLTDASDDSAGEYIQEPELYAVKKRGRQRKKPQISKTKASRADKLPSRPSSQRRAKSVQEELISLPPSRIGTPWAADEEEISFLGALPPIQPPNPDAEIVFHSGSPKGADPIAPSFTTPTSVDAATNAYVNDEPANSYFRVKSPDSQQLENDKIDELLNLAQDSKRQDSGLESLDDMLNSRARFKAKNVTGDNEKSRDPTRSRMFHRVKSQKKILGKKYETTERIKGRISDAKDIYGTSQPKKPPRVRSERVLRNIRETELGGTPSTVYTRKSLKSIKPRKDMNM